MTLACGSGAPNRRDGGDETPEGAADEAGEPDAAPEAGDAEVADDAPPPPVCGNGVVETGEECDGDPPQACLTSCSSNGTQACGECRRLECEAPD